MVEDEEEAMQIDDIISDGQEGNPYLINIPDDTYTNLYLYIHTCLFHTCQHKNNTAKFNDVLYSY